MIDHVIRESYDRDTKARILKMRKLLAVLLITPALVGCPMTPLLGWRLTRDYPATQPAPPSALTPSQGDSHTNSVPTIQASDSYVISTAIGTGAQGFSGDGGPANLAQLNAPTDAVMDSAGNLYLCDRSNYRIRKVSPWGIITTVAGNGDGTSIGTMPANGDFGNAGDGGPATNAQLMRPQGIALDRAGNLYIADTDNNRVRKVGVDGVIRTVAGKTVAGKKAYGFSGDGGPATDALLDSPSGVAVDGAGNLYIADYGNNRIRKVDTDGIITTVAGNGTAGYSGDDGPATSAHIAWATKVAVDQVGNLYISDSYNGRVRKVDPEGIITTVAGCGSGFDGDGRSATEARFSFFNGLTVDGGGNLYLADTQNNRIRRVGADGIVTTFAGNGLQGFLGDGGAPDKARLDKPEGIAIDRDGNLYIADTGNHCIRKLVAPTVAK